MDKIIDMKLRIAKKTGVLAENILGPLDRSTNPETYNKGKGNPPASVEGLYIRISPKTGNPAYAYYRPGYGGGWGMFATKQARAMERRLKKSKKQADWYAYVPGSAVVAA